MCVLDRCVVCCACLLCAGCRRHRWVQRDSPAAQLSVVAGHIRGHNRCGDDCAGRRWEFWGGVQGRAGNRAEACSSRGPIIVYPHRWVYPVQVAASRLNTSLCKTHFRLTSVCVRCTPSAAGVAPGEYEVVWVIDAHPAHMRYEGPTYSMSAAAEPLGLEPMPEHSFGGPTAAGAGAGGSMDSAGTGAGAGASAGNSSMTAAGAVIATAAGVVDYMRRMRALWLGQAPQATTSSSSGVSADAGNSSGGQAQGSGSSVSISMNERQMVHSLRPTHQWGALPGTST